MEKDENVEKDAKSDDFSLQKDSDVQQPSVEDSVEDTPRFVENTPRFSDDGKEENFARYEEDNYVEEMERGSQIQQNDDLKQARSGKF